MKTFKALQVAALCLTLGATSVSAANITPTSNDNNNGILIAAVLIGLLVWIGHEYPKPAPATRGDADPSGTTGDSDVLMKF
ncbi:MAG: hypothetical protein GC146_13105 [Limimaricola sp.]|uniref:hypothetical protein n=1 Tax=Limimaricola sp. TaxID=2211665 RepID=UPI001DD7652B|nr:hypothetical protein [Limimaricola sp.]MBI1418154.1 hypothetical protein [Limimaricola sp.]